MAKYKITDNQTGRTVVVSGDSPPTEEEAQAIFADAGLRQPVTKQQVKQPGLAEDAVRSVPGGLAKGTAPFFGSAGDISAIVSGGTIADGKVSRGIVPSWVPIIGGIPMPTTKGVLDAVSQPFGGMYEPKRISGHYAETISSFAPAALMPGTALQRGMRVVLGGAGTETGRQLTKGSALEPYAGVVGGVAGGLAADPFVRGINVLTSKAGAPITDPNIAARSMMADAVRRDGGPSVVRANLDAWRGASNPALIDVSGNNVRRLVRSAASGGAGEAQNTAISYADRIAGNLQDNSLSLTRRLTPGVQQSADAYGAGLEEARQAAARASYAGPYAKPAIATKEMVSALQGPEGRSAISRAYAAARANRDVQQMGELRDLLAVATEQGGGVNQLTGSFQSIQQALENVSAGSLDRVRIAMRETGRSLAARGARDMARGYGGRVRDIDTALDQTPGLQAARAQYRDFALQQDALDLGRTGLNASPETYGATISDLAAQSQGARQAAGVGYRQNLTDSISRPAEGATGVLNRISTSDAQRRNLAATFGDQTAADYQTGIGNEISRVRNSRFISPNTGSQTELRLQDAGLLELPISKVGIIAHAWDKIKSASTLTEAERNALVRLGTSEAQLQDLARANPSLTSRALAQAVIGANSARK